MFVSKHLYMFIVYLFLCFTCENKVEIEAYDVTSCWFQGEIEMKARLHKRDTTIDSSEIISTCEYIHYSIISEFALIFKIKVLDYLRLILLMLRTYTIAHT